MKVVHNTNILLLFLTPAYSQSSVTAEGSTTATTSDTAPPVPAGFTVGNPPTYYDITTTATFSGPVTICIPYDPAQYTNGGSLQLLHYENNQWVNVTASHDTVGHVICGNVNSLSPFVLASASAESCKKDGWQQFTSAPGPFKNQGQCVSYFNRQKKK